MGKVIDITGKKFGQLTVCNLIETNRNGSYWNCKCECGNYKKVSKTNLKSGQVKSCGCLCKETSKKTMKNLFTKHGKSQERLYKIWIGIKSRCNNPNETGYENYGGRGIKMCDCIKDFENFYNYMSKLEHYEEKGYTIDRINVDGNYCICNDNLRWASKSEQGMNKRISKINESGITGVRKFILNNGTISWRANITINKKTIHLGCYATKEEAIEARRNAENSYWNKTDITKGKQLSLSNTSGVTGVTWNNNRNKWIAQITINYRHIGLGYFDTKEDAIEARHEAEIKYRL